MIEQLGVHILVADDDLDDCFLTEQAFRDASFKSSLHFVHDGEQLMSYLRREPPYNDSDKYPFPGLILLDLNMPLKDGREALLEIKHDAELCSIPVVIITTSSAQEDIEQSYAEGVNSYITKPTSFNGLQEMVQSVGRYWLETVRLPTKGPES
ncbi:response regulator [Ottowia caeni]|uniref:response regulator n=1 Tax=Ottowia caeni TaxID=2870339 RepID=UPI001E3F5C59|nr:response regulator [Ottowia caeni]